MVIVNNSEPREANRLYYNHNVLCWLPDRWYKEDTSTIACYVTSRHAIVGLLLVKLRALSAAAAAE